MREIEFRGKRRLDGTWIYGGFYTKDGMTFIHDKKHGFTVDPETVGQYTGLKDRNGVKIFEGDVVKSDKYYIEEDPVIRYTSGGFGVDGGLMLVSQVLETLEVIGNIHDNPKLLRRR